jgi:hypothetical protein
VQVVVPHNPASTVSRQLPWPISRQL